LFQVFRRSPIRPAHVRIALQVIAPELLDEVISNLRALLKLAPRYTVGYRVLGDAYMRQGEYLQAMEAYNKALTMAKKAKSQSH